MMLSHLQELLFYCAEFILAFNLEISPIECSDKFRWYYREDDSHAAAYLWMDYVEINQYYWYSTHWKERREVIFHELGHLELDLEHNIKEHGWTKDRIMRQRFCSSCWTSWDKLVKDMKNEYIQQSSDILD